MFYSEQNFYLILAFFFVTGYLNVLVNSQWRTRWCMIKNGKLWFYQDKGKSKVSQQPVPLEGCTVLPDPSPEHLYSFRIHMDGEQLATLEVILISYWSESLKMITLRNSIAAWKKLTSAWIFPDLIHFRHALLHPSYHTYPIPHTATLSGKANRV